jgi:imidazole glycerol-phosphate synthase subunit HisH
MLKVGIINYGMGNIQSIQNILLYLGIKSEVISRPEKIEKKTHIILPGVGSFKSAMRNLEKMKLVNPIKDYASKKNKKLLGICLGMQLLGKSSEESKTIKGLGLVDLKFKLFTNQKSIKIPHIGFNEIFIKKDKYNFFLDIKNNSDFYFNHSYRVARYEKLETEIVCNYGGKFLAAFQKKNIFGTQFHPEKSQSNGLKLLINFFKK